MSLDVLICSRATNKMSFLPMAGILYEIYSKKCCSYFGIHCLKKMC